MHINSRAACSYFLFGEVRKVKDFNSSLQRRIPMRNTSMNICTHANVAKIGVILRYVVLMVIVTCSRVNGDASKDREECADQLAGLATCLPYVQGEARAPTPDCCGGLKQLLKTSKKCLCVIVKDGNDPQLGLNINVTLAVDLPSICQAPANVSQCPALLHLDPHSPEAQVFYQSGSSNGTSGHVDSRTSPSGSPTGAPTAAPGGFTTNAPQQSNGMQMKTGPRNTIAVGCALLLWFLWSSLLEIIA